MNGSRKATGYGDNSVDRFATACSMVQQFQASGANEDAVDYAFSILDKIALGSYTRWRIVYDITNREIAFVTTGSRKSLRLNDFDFTCGAGPLYLDINSTRRGNVKPFFVPLSFEQNQKVLQQSARESRSQIVIPEESIRGLRLTCSRCNAVATEVFETHRSFG